MKRQIKRIIEIREKGIFDWTKDVLSLFIIAIEFDY